MDKSKEILMLFKENEERAFRELFNSFYDNLLLYAIQFLNDSETAKGAPWILELADLPRCRFCDPTSYADLVLLRAAQISACGTRVLCADVAARRTAQSAAEMAGDYSHIFRIDSGCVLCIFYCTRGRARGSPHARVDGQALFPRPQRRQKAAVMTCAENRVQKSV